MKISTKGRYALRLMLDIVQHNDGEPVRVKDIAARQEISVKYLEQIVSILVRAGYLKSIRGPQGGYRLTRPPAEITVGDVLRCLEGGLNLVGCLEEDSLCGKTCACPSRFVWLRIRDGLNAIVDGITLQDMLDDNARSSPV